ncbi:rhodanese-like domain-containing protein [Deinococcus lacus]|uniref:Rhodanese-like domain-containing protein n=1 Tax=Deinococcus lacus TaxID=392561 RepID=A0ABW1YGF3_9DEIO
MLKTVWGGLLGALGLVGCGAQSGVQTVDVAALRAAQQAQSGTYVLDVRTPGEYAAGHIEGAVLLPLQELPQRLSEVPAGQPVYVVCRSGKRSAQASRLLAEAGQTPLNVVGGMNAWTAAGYPVVK